MRKNFFQFPGRITMVKSVTDGIYVSYRKNQYEMKSYFLSGLDPFEFTRREIAGSSAIEGSATKIPSEEFSGGGIGSIVVWASNEGIFVGSPGGIVKNKTWNHYSCDDVDLGASVLREDNGFNQYMFVYEVDFDMRGALEVPSLQTAGLLL